MDLDLFARRIGALRQRVVERVRSVNEVTSRETMAAGKALGRVVAVAREQIANLKRAIAASTDGALHVSVRELAAHVTTQTAAIRDALLHHQRRVEDASARALEIREAARRVESLTREARVLAINAMIEAGRARGDGGGMTAIADEMQRLSKAIAATNATIQQIADDLGSSLPAVIGDGAKVVSTTVEFQQTAGARIAAIERCAGELRGHVEKVVSAADQALGTVIGESYAALSHLQFQDVCAQRLLEIDRWVCELERAHAGTTEVAAPVQQRLGDGEQDEPTGIAGDVMLF